MLGVLQPGEYNPRKGDRVVWCNKPPIASGMVSEHIKRAPFEWNPRYITLLTADDLGCKEKAVTVEWIREKLAEKKLVPLNACFLDYLCANSEHVPEPWISKIIEFPGTVYRTRGKLYCRTLSFNESGSHIQWTAEDYTGSKFLANNLIAACAMR